MSGLSGCKTLLIDEAFVFQPGQFGSDASAPRDTQMRYERIFQEPTDMVIDVWADGQKAKHVIRSNEFVKSSVTHGFIEGEGQSLGMTLIARSNENGGSRPLVVHCGGNASDRYESAALYAQKVIPFADILMFDYPGYGESSGRATAISLRAANRVISKFAAKTRGDDRQLLLWGHSLGGFVCADMAQNFEKVDGIILEATAANAKDVSAVVIPWYAKLFVKTRVAETLQTFDIVETLQQIDTPILILGGAKDKTLPVKLSQNLSVRLKDEGANVTYVEFPEGNHISIPIQDTYVTTVENFVSHISRKLE